ncbi:MAG: lysine-2,3-aminomutase-like protein [Rhodospirillaceae bacterium]|nr:lysine-2,3-aminomutase-like protein [Rhodospirillaceae bacterium]
MTDSPSRRTLRDIDDLVGAGLVEAGARDGLKAVAARYAVGVSPDMADLMGADAADPIRRQFLPDAAELRTSHDQNADPTGDDRFTPVKGIVHRYPDRVLLKPVHACAVYCRFCFRRERVGPGGEALTPAELEAALDYVRQRPAIWEVILTGGDPLILSTRRLRRLVAALDAIAHLGAIRIHTRLPVAAPDSVGPALTRSLAAEKAVYVVIHCNHPREVTPRARAALRRLSDAGIPLLSQTVLLKGVNDDPATLDALFRALVAARVKPYYLHHLDAAPGTGHFRTTIAHGQDIVRGLRARVSGLCQPNYVLDIPGGHGKVPIGPVHLRRAEDETDAYVVEDAKGGHHLYRSPA